MVWIINHWYAIAVTVSLADFNEIPHKYLYQKEHKIYNDKHIYMIWLCKLV